MKNFNLLLIMVFLFFYQKGFSQSNSNLITKVGTEYHYQGKTYSSIRSLKKVFQIHPRAYYAYKGYILDRRIHRTACLGSALGFAWTINWQKKHKEKPRPLSDGDIVQGLIVPFLGYTVSIVLILGTGIPLYRHMEQPIRIFNEEVTSSKVGSFLPELNFKISQNGIGLALNF